MDKIYYTLLATLVALQSQFRTFIEDRPGLMTDTNELEKPWTGLAYKVTMDLNRLTDIEEQSAELEENLRRTMIEISSSQGRMSPLWMAILNLQRRLEGLQANVRAAIRILSGRSTGNYWRRTLFRTMLENKIKDQQQLFEEDSDDDLYSTRVSEVPVPVQLSPQQQLDEDSDDDLYSNRVSEVQVPVQSSPWFEDEINDDLYGYRFRVPVFSSPPVHVSVHWQPLEEDSDDDLYSTRVSEVPVPVQSSPQFEDEIEDDLYDYSIPELELSSTSSHQFEEDIVCELSEEMDLEIPTRVLSSSQFEDEIEDDLYDYSIPELELSSTSSHQFEEDIVCELSEEMDLEIPTRVLSSSQFEDEIEDDLYDYSIPELELSSTSSHQFEEDIVCELSEEMDLEIPTRVLSSSQQQFDEEIDDDLYVYRFPIPVLSSPPQQLDEDSDDDLYSNRVSEVQVPVQSSPWVRIRGLFQRIQQFMNDFGRLLSRV
ncbi:uncharacterized protein LOC119007325 isoform X6 [Acanthopagrus latus]|uniref:uncharacterized protein LOC119007325 isoform X6 n=1 Tax=Acanthopagrus latus TaxID=8177 RepID=UPI00187C5FA1|nr:uncharacterized protein LOC119007325 isoform X6 [Acanthopagrus latus]